LKGAGFIRARGSSDRRLQSLRKREGKAIVAAACKSKVACRENRRLCMEMEQNPAYYYFGVLKHWARLDQQVLTHSRHGNSEAKYLNRQRNEPHSFVRTSHIRRRISQPP
jgi:hypothetical protein